MKIATVMYASLLCAGMCSAYPDGPQPVIACNLGAIGSAERPRYDDLMKRLRAAARTRNELSGGYAFHLDAKAITLPEVAEWMSMERLCCPFLTLELSASGQRADWVLTVTGPAGVKAFLQAEFAARSK